MGEAELFSTPVLASSKDQGFHHCQPDSFSPTLGLPLCDVDTFPLQSLRGVGDTWSLLGPGLGDSGLGSLERSPETCMLNPAPMWDSHPGAMSGKCEIIWFLYWAQRGNEGG